MNEHGRPENLVAAHPGNLHALKSGAHSPRLIEARASEILDELGIAAELDAAGKVVLWEVARLTAVIEAIERDLSDRGLTDRNGNERYLLQRRDRCSSRLMEAVDRLLDAQVRMRREKALAFPSDIEGKRSDYMRELRSIALGHVSEARTSDRLAALKLLLELKDGALPSGWMHPADPERFKDDADFQEKVSKLRAKQEEADKAGILSRMERNIANAHLGL